MAFSLLPSFLSLSLLVFLFPFAQAQVGNNSTNITSSGAGQDYTYSTNVTRKVVFDVTSGFIAPDGEFRRRKRERKRKGIDELTDSSSLVPRPSDLFYRKASTGPLF